MFDMRSVNLASIDLNLLLVVATVLEEGSATRAAARLHVGQSAVSNALKRARELFDDPLVVRQPHGLTPTPHAAALSGPLRAWLEEARRLVARAPSFDARTTTRSFAIACVDAMTITLVPALLRVLRRSAPAASLRVLTLDRMIAGDGLAQGEIDLLIGLPPVIPPGHAAELLFRDPMRCIVPRGTPALTLERFAQMPHVELALFGETDDTVDRALARRGRSRRIAVAMPHFAAIPLAVVETGGVATLARRVAESFAAGLPLDVMRPPVPLPELEIRQLWHRASEHDPAHAFLRRCVREAASASPALKRGRPRAYRGPS